MSEKTAADTPEWFTSAVFENSDIGVSYDPEYSELFTALDAALKRFKDERVAIIDEEGSVIDDFVISFSSTEFVEGEMSYIPDHYRNVRRWPIADTPYWVSELGKLVVVDAVCGVTRDVSPSDVKTKADLERILLILASM